MNRIMTVELSGNNDTYTNVTLPLTPFEMLDALDKLRMTPQDKPDWEICSFHDYRELHNWIGSGTLYELNALCTRLSELNAQEHIAFDGLLEVQKEKNSSIIPMHQLLDLAYSTGQCHLLTDVHNVEQLGRFAAENGFVPNVDLMSDEVFEMLDFRLLGERFMSGEGGVIVNGGYVAQDGDLAQDVWKTLELPVRKPDYTVLLELGYMDADQTTMLKLPASPAELDAALARLDAASWAEVSCRCADCRVPAMCDMITFADNVAHANRAAEYLERVPEEELPKFKALLGVLKIAELHEALDLTQKLDQYSLAADRTCYESVAKESLIASLGENKAKVLLPHIGLYSYGQALQEECKVVLTDYGSVERLYDPTLAEQEPITRESSAIELNGYVGTWHVVDEAICAPDNSGDPFKCFLLENDQFGSTVGKIIVGERGDTLLDYVWDGFEEQKEAGWTVQEPAQEQTGGMEMM